MAAVAAREAVARDPGAWRAGSPTALEPLRRAGREGYAPTEAERRRLAAAGNRRAASLCAVGGRTRPRAARGPWPAPAPRPGRWRAAGARYRRAVERGLAAGGDGGRGRARRRPLGRGPRSPAAAASLEGPPAAELARLRAELELGRLDRSGARRAQAPPDALGAGRRVRRSAALASSSPAATSPGFCDASPPSSAERDRVAADARAATAQARFTGLLVVAMPAGAALFAELIEPGFVGGLLSNGAAAVLLAAAAAFQLGGFASDPASQPDRGRMRWAPRRSSRWRCFWGPPHSGSWPGAGRSELGRSTRGAAATLSGGRARTLAGCRAVASGAAAPAPRRTGREHPGGSRAGRKGRRGRGGRPARSGGCPGAARPAGDRRRLRAPGGRIRHPGGAAGEGGAAARRASRRGAPRRPRPAGRRNRRRTQPGHRARRDLDRRRRAAGLRAGGRGGRDPVRRAAARSDRGGSRARARLGAWGAGVRARALPPVRLAARRPAPRSGRGAAS